VLVHLKQADGVFILGSTESHYTPSKAYQGVLSGKPILAVLHKESTALEVLLQSNAGIVLAIDEKTYAEVIVNEFPSLLENFLVFARQFSAQQINRTLFDDWSAKSVTSQLAGLLNTVISKKEGKGAELF
jgi:hypothetical protein